MAKLVFAALGVVLFHEMVARSGSPEAAVWLTGVLGCSALISFALARA
jgi:hypothetical protein